MSYIQIFPKESQIEKEAYPMPWRSDACCYNFHTPKIFIPDDRINEMITDPLDVETLVVTSDLEDYSFISDMKNLTEYSRAAEPPVRCGESHVSGLTGATLL